MAEVLLLGCSDSTVHLLRLLGFAALLLRFKLHLLGFVVLLLEFAFPLLGCLCSTLHLKESRERSEIALASLLLLDHRQSSAESPSDYHLRPDVLPDHPLRPDVLPDHHQRPDVLPNHHLRPDVLPDNHLRPDVLPDHHLRPDVLLDRHLRPDVLPDRHLRLDVLPDHHLRPDVLLKARHSVRSPLDARRSAGPPPNIIPPPNYRLTPELETMNFKDEGMLEVSIKALTEGSSICEVAEFAMINLLNHACSNTM
ncbi:hypothetical protein M5K25_006288 [Dendrobium thyrsiflorum]|uniref:Uncharacterized protein n=1 Tax=Dendrobium thyrsiflorum TaxID=117978 RepID=A0ABD0VCE7_DENTH